MTREDELKAALREALDYIASSHDWCGQWKGKKLVKACPLCVATDKWLREREALLENAAD